MGREEVKTAGRSSVAFSQPVRGEYVLCKDPIEVSYKHLGETTTSEHLSERSELCSLKLSLRACCERKSASGKAYIHPGQ
jgi:hypothetical protein